ncbi:MAG TPA: exodeoxyribonuclease VII small subunit [Methylophilaceae bacterium]|nr:exodeoxyribonuclease VII small subunit [Methylophilaceae bacterium]
MSKIKQNADSSNANLSFANLSFESAITELEAIVSQMEANQLPLEQSLSSYKRGTELLQFCQKTLADVEQQVRILNESSQLQPYTDNDD